MLVLDRDSGKAEHKYFPQILEYFSPKDLLLLNDTRVIPARLLGKKIPTGGKVEVLLLNEVKNEGWNALFRPSRRARPGTVIEFEPEGKAEVRNKRDGKGVILKFAEGVDVGELIRKIGYPPLPPYIKRDLRRYPDDLKSRDRERYQTVFARRPGAVAAPTAGFHFTEELLQEIRQLGVRIAWITLHVGYGTFQPVRAEIIQEHKMHAEYYEISRETADEVNTLKERGGSLWVVGTTTVRALESAADDGGRVGASSGWTDIFIYPGYRFKLDFNLVTNFHLPRSTLIMLVSALAGKEKIMKSYREAIERGYRFYSFGDAMLIL